MGCVADGHVTWPALLAGILASQAPDPERLFAGFGPSLRRSPTWVAAAAAEHVAGFCVAGGSQVGRGSLGRSGGAVFPLANGL